MNHKSDAFSNHLGHTIAIQCSSSAHSSAWKFPDTNTAALWLLPLQTTLLQLLSTFSYLNMKLVTLQLYYKSMHHISGQYCTLNNFKCKLDKLIEGTFIVMPAKYLDSKTFLPDYRGQFVFIRLLPNKNCLAIILLLWYFFLEHLSKY